MQEHIVKKIIQIKIIAKRSCKTYGPNLI